MIVPPSLAPSPSSSLLSPSGASAPSPNGGDGVPSQTNLLMAAAEMHKLGRLVKPKAKAAA